AADAIDGRVDEIGAVDAGIEPARIRRRLVVVVGVRIARGTLIERKQEITGGRRGAVGPRRARGARGIGIDTLNVWRIAAALAGERYEVRRPDAAIVW